MHRIFYGVGGLTALLGVLVLADNVRNLKSSDEMPIVTMWVGGWLLIGMGALIRAANNKG